MELARVLLLAAVSTIRLLRAESDGDGLTRDEVDVRVLLWTVSNRAQVGELVAQALDHLSDV